MRGRTAVFKCRICGNRQGNREHKVPEVMDSVERRFAYVECGACGCLQIRGVPRDLAAYYGKDYYTREPVEDASKSALRLWAKNFRDHYAVFGSPFWAAPLAALAPAWPELASLRACDLKKESRVLDVGCGQGRVLKAMSDLGMKDLLGVDPFLDKNLAGGEGLRFLRRSLFELQGTFNLLMFHHSFEHMDQPLKVLKRSWSLLASGGRCLLRVPTVSSHAWRHYGVRWVQLDAPRHLYLHSLKSLSLLAGQAGFQVEATFFDSTAFQFWGSEQALRGVAVKDPRSYDRDPSASMFSPSEIRGFQRRARELNRRREGDSVAFVLRKI